jgi:hypothetical protein
VILTSAGPSLCDGVRRFAQDSCWISKASTGYSMDLTWVMWDHGSGGWRVFLLDTCSLGYVLARVVVTAYRLQNGKEPIVFRLVLGTIVCLFNARIDCFSLFFFKMAPRGAPVNGANPLGSMGIKLSTKLIINRRKCINNITIQT